jgi:hypothetical protein
MVPIERLYKSGNEYLVQHEIPSIIYHYTSQYGLLSILESKSLWASKIRYTNDSSEFVQTIKWVENELNERKVSADDEELGAIEDLLMDIENIGELNICICSFTKNGNLLSQWRGYGGQAIGYSIGFDSKSLIEVSSAHGFVFVKCVYNKEEQSNILCRFIDSAIRRASENRGEIDDIVEELCFIASFMKNSHFGEEDEWRLLSGAQNSKSEWFKFRSGANAIIPYYSIPLEGNKNRPHIEEIVCGPTEHPELVKSALSQALFKFGYYASKEKRTNIKLSEIPYRKW